MLITSRKNSLYFQLIILLCCAAIGSGLLFFCMNAVGEQAIDEFYLKSDYTSIQNEKYISKLQDYVEKNELNIRDVQEVNKWVKSQHVINIELYQNDILIYDSEYPEMEALWEKNISDKFYEWNEYYTIQFQDGEAEVNIFGLYDYQIYNYAFLIELVIAFAVYLLMVILGIRKKINYILKLSNEIEILEGGNLDYKITVFGNDELTMLANGLDCMRKSFKNQLIQEADMVRENQSMITEMSHDLRTPITSMMLYITILKKDKDMNKEKLEEYLNKLEKKAGQMKQLTDHLFEYALVTGENEVKLDNLGKMSILFYDLLSETCYYLEQKGFSVKVNINWSDKKIRVCMNYITRIMDNIISNIIKYADPKKPIKIESVEDVNMIGFLFINTIINSNEKVESNGIGINSIKNMMIKMEGKCEIFQKDDRFQLLILFPS